MFCIARAIDSFVFAYAFYYLDKSVPDMQVCYNSYRVASRELNLYKKSWYQKKENSWF